MLQSRFKRIYDEKSDSLKIAAIKPDFFLESKRQPLEKELDNPGALVLYVSSVCNGDCLYCYAAESHKNGKLMDFPIAKAAIDAFAKRSKKINVVFFGEGEPTLAFSLIRKIVEYLRYKRKTADLEFGTHLLTNGFFSRSKAEWIFENIDKISVSCDGPADIHNITRRRIGGKASHALLERNIKYFIARDSRKIRLKTVINPFSLERQTEVLEYFYRLGYQGEALFAPLIDSKQSKINDLKPLGGKFADNFLATTELNDYLGTGISLMTRLVELSPKTAACGLSRSNFYATPDGSVACCSRAISANRENNPFFYGAFRNNELRIDREKEKSLRRRTVNNLEDCEECFLRWVCAGGCAFEHFEKTRDLMKLDKKICEKRKREAEKYLLFQARRETSDLRPFFITDNKGKEIALSLWSGELTVGEKDNPIIVIDSDKDDFQKLFKKIKNHRDRRGFKLTIFFLRFVSGSKKQNNRKIIDFLSNLKKEKIHFKLTRPIPEKSIGDREKLIKEYGMPTTAAESLDFFSVRRKDRIFFGKTDSGMVLKTAKTRKALADSDNGKIHSEALK
ncbi:MAG TPA: radical SAM protein [Candidatus Colwellbacteria bacterium]|nr:radical SAM protein [Candidatus Colwellbacteria bacterium]